MNFRNRSQTGNERGTAIIELALVLPLFVAVAMVGLEVSRALSFSQAAVTLSREASSQAFRKCGSFWSTSTADAETLRRAGSCLETEKRALETFARRSFEGTEVRLAVYRYGPPGVPPACNTPTFNAGFTRIATTAGGTYPTRFNFRNAQGVPDPALSAGPTVENLDSRTACLVRALVVAEVTIPYVSVSGAAGTLFTFNPTEFYSASTM